MATNPNRIPLLGSNPITFSYRLADTLDSSDISDTSIMSWKICHCIYVRYLHGSYLERVLIKVQQSKSCIIRFSLCKYATSTFVYFMWLSCSLHDWWNLLVDKILKTCEKSKRGLMPPRFYKEQLLQKQENAKIKPETSVNTATPIDQIIISNPIRCCYSVTNCPWSTFLPNTEPPLLLKFLVWSKSWNCPKIWYKL